MILKQWKFRQNSRAIRRLISRSRSSLIQKAWQYTANIGIQATGSNSGKTHYAVLSRSKPVVTINQDLSRFICVSSVSEVWVVLVRILNHTQLALVLFSQLSAADVRHKANDGGCSLCDPSVV